MKGLCWAVLSSALATTALADARVEAFDPKTGELRFVGNARRPTPGKPLLKTRWCRTDGTPVLEAAADFDPETNLGSATWTDLRSGREKRIEVGANEVKIAYRKSGKDKLESSVLSRSTTTIAPESMLDVIRSNFTTLEQGTATLVALALVDRARTIDFRLTRASIDDATLVVRAEPTSWLVRRFVEPIIFHVARTPGRELREINGPGSVPHEDGEMQSLRTVYTVVPAETSLPCDLR